MAEQISAVPREARSYQGQGAGLVSRTVASVVDALIVLAALGVGYVGINAVVFAVNPRRFELVSASLIISLAAVLLGLVGYLTAAWSLTGRSYGDHVMGLRVVGRAGQPLRLPWALARAAFCVAFPLGLLWCAGSRSRRSVQDILLGTSVIYDWGPRRPSPETTSRSEGFPSAG